MVLGAVSLRRVNGSNHRTNTLLALVGVVLIAGAVWWFGRATDPGVVDAGVATNERADGRAAVATGDAQQSAFAPSPANADATSVEAATGHPFREAARLDGAPRLRVRLRGLHPDAPWTAPLHLDMQAQVSDTSQFLEDAASAIVDADGRGTFVLPTWWRRTPPFSQQIASDDDHYFPLRYFQRGTLDLDAELVLDVQPRARLAGRVVDAQGATVEGARIAVFAIHRDVVVDPQVANARTNALGTFELDLPPDVPHLVLAIDSHRSDCLPVQTRTTTRVGTITRLPDLVLALGVRLEGQARWSDGSPIADATVRLAQDAGTVLHEDYRGREQIFIDHGGTVGLTNTQTDGDGRFVLTLPNALPVDVELSLPPHVAGRSSVRRTAQPPQRLDFVVPLPIALKATLLEEQDNASIEFQNGDPQALVRAGEILTIAVPSTPTQVRAVSGRFRSEWTTIGPAQAGTEVRLTLAEGRTEVAVDLAGGSASHAFIECTDASGRTSRQNWSPRKGPFRLFLDPGHWQVSLQVWRSGEDRVAQPLPVERTIDVGTEPMTIVVPLERGGSLCVTATDRSGRHVPGTCRIVDHAGRDWSVGFSVIEPERVRGGGSPRLWTGGKGELLPRGTNRLDGALRPGDYELQFEFVGYGARHQRVTIRAGETTDVHVKL